MTRTAAAGTATHFVPVNRADAIEGDQIRRHGVYETIAAISHYKGSTMITLTNGGTETYPANWDLDIRRAADTVPGTPATIILYTDTLPAVVTKVTATQVGVRRVEHGEFAPAPHYGDPMVIRAEGDTAKPIGEEETFRLRKDGSYYSSGGQRLTLGTSYRLIDNRF